MEDPVEVPARRVTRYRRNLSSQGTVERDHYVVTSRRGPWARREDFRGLASVDVRQVLGFTGCLFLVLGIFSPLLTVPVVGITVTYIGRGTGDGVFIFVPVLLALALISTRRYAFLIWPAVLAIGLMALTFVLLQGKISDLQEESSSSFETSIGSAVQLQWGWGLLLAGVICLFTASQIKER